MKRNPEATCGNCPYFEKHTGVIGIAEGNGSCLILPPINVILHPKTGTKRTLTPVTNAVFWCGQHPDFELKEKEGA